MDSICFVYCRRNGYQFKDLYKIWVSNIDPNIQLLVVGLYGADHPNLGAKLGLTATWSYDIIKQVGNYEEIFERNITKKLGLKRDLNKLYNRGGLLYAPPLK